MGEMHHIYHPLPQSRRNALARFLADWILVLAMLSGTAAYLLYHHLPSPALHRAGPALLGLCNILQPALISIMLLLNFCKVDLRKMRPHKWQAIILFLQCALFAAAALAIHLSEGGDSALARWTVANRIPIEAAMICLICPTASSAGVVTDRLGGSVTQVVTYTVMINLVASIMIPLFIPLIYPSSMGFVQAAVKITGKVFPMLILPLLAAAVLRYFMPKVHSFLLKYAYLSFYIWAFSLSMAIAISVRSLVQGRSGAGTFLWIAFAAALSCIVQFVAGKKTGSRFGCRITAGQSMAQKNTIFAIWVGYTFMDPLTSLAGGFYSLAQNIFNSYQLYCRRKLEEKGSAPRKED